MQLPSDPDEMRRMVPMGRDMDKELAPGHPTKGKLFLAEGTWL